MKIEEVDEAKTNPWLYEKLEKKNPADENLELLVEVTRGTTREVAEDLEDISGITVRDPVFNYVPVTAPPEAIPMIQRIPNVEQVHYSMPRTIHSLPQIGNINFNQLIPKQTLVPVPQFEDPLIGKYTLSKIEVPGIPLQALPAFPVAKTPFTEIAAGVQTSVGSFLNQVLPTDTLSKMLLRLVKTPEVDRVIPTGISRKLLHAPEDNRIAGTKCCVLDTGCPVENHYLWKKSQNKGSFTGETPYDGLGHGTWCQTCAFGKEGETRFGTCKGVADVPGMLMYAGKVLSNVGSGTTESVLRGMEWAVKNEVDVVSMSLGGPAQGGVENDPEAKIIQRTGDEICWILAAGNSGPTDWTIGSPAFAPKALTVGAYSMLGKDVADFSSRGPSTGWYQENPEAWERDLARYGEDLVKPDVLAPGGGPATGEEERDDIYSGVQGWMDAIGDLTVESLGPMRGTSMATPHVAGLMALLLDLGVIDGVADVKNVMKEQELIPDEERYGDTGKSVAKGSGFISFNYFSI